METMKFDSCSCHDVLAECVDVRARALAPLLPKFARFVQVMVLCQATFVQNTGFTRIVHNKVVVVPAVITWYVANWDTIIDFRCWGIW